MTIPFPSDEWVKALQTELNNSQAYKEAAKSWEGDITFVVQPGGGLTEERYLYMDLWHGECRQANALSDLSAVDSEFQISAPYPTWRRVLEGQLDPIRGLMTRQLKLKGPMMKVMKAPKAAVELVNCGKKLDTAWPS